MLFSIGCMYGIQAVLYLAAIDAEGYTSARQIGKALDISPPFLSKVLRRLKEKDIIKTRRGPGGGVALAQRPHHITLRELIVALDGEGLFTTCVLGLPGCGTAVPCPLHEQWQPLRARLDATFDKLDVQAAAVCMRDVLSCLAEQTSSPDRMATSATQ